MSGPEGTYPPVELDIETSDAPADVPRDAVLSVRNLTVEFSSENGAAPLSRHFAHVERRDAKGTVVFPDRDALQAYLSSLIRGRELADRLPDFAGELRARSRQSIFVADKA